MEYLVSRYVEAGNPVAGQHKIDKILTEDYAESTKKELIKSRIKEKGQYTLLGQLSLLPSFASPFCPKTWLITFPSIPMKR